MEVPVSPVIAAELSRKLERQYNSHVLGYEGIVADYTACLRKAKDLQVRNRQLEKEAGELRIENDTALRQLEVAQSSSASREEVTTLEAEAKRLREEVTSLYREKADLAKEALDKSEQLQVVRESNEHLSKQVDELSSKHRELKERARKVEEEAKRDRDAAELSAAELETQRRDKEEYHSRLMALEAEQGVLSQRLVDAKSSEAERMNEVNRMCEEMIANAKQLELQARQKLEAMVLQERATAASSSRTAAGGGASLQQRPGSSGQQQQHPFAAHQQQAPGGVGGGSNPQALAGQLVGGLRGLFARKQSNASSSSSPFNAMAGGPWRDGSSAGGWASRQPSASEAIMLPELPELPPLPAMQESGPPKLPMKAIMAHEGGCYGLAFDRGGNHVASCGADRTVKLWDPQHGMLLTTLHGMPETVMSVDFTADQRCVIAAGKDLQLWDTASGRRRHTLTGHNPHRVNSVACSPADPTRAASAANDRTLKVWDLTRGWCLRTIMCSSKGLAVAMTRDGALLCSGHMDGTLRCWDLRSGRLAREITGLHTSDITSVAAGMAGNSLLTCGKDNSLRLVDLRSFEVTATLRAPGFSVAGGWSHACLAPNERYAAAGSADGTVFIWNTAPGSAAVVEQLDRKHHHSNAVASAQWSPLFSSLVSCDVKGHLVFWQS